MLYQPMDKPYDHEWWLGYIAEFINAAGGHFDVILEMNLAYYADKNRVAWPDPPARALGGWD